MSTPFEEALNRLQESMRRKVREEILHIARQMVDDILKVDLSLLPSLPPFPVGLLEPEPLNIPILPPGSRTLPVARNYGIPLQPPMQVDPRKFEKPRYIESAPGWLAMPLPAPIMKYGVPSFRILNGWNLLTDSEEIWNGTIVDVPIIVTGINPERR